MGQAIAPSLTISRQFRLLQQIPGVFSEAVGSGGDRASYPGISGEDRSQGNLRDRRIKTYKMTSVTSLDHGQPINSSPSSWLSAPWFLETLN